MRGKSLLTGLQEERDRADAQRSPLDGLFVIAEEHALQLELCDLLEFMADGLPAEVNKALALAAVGTLTSVVPAHTRLEEEALFPVLRRRLAPGDAVIQALRCLESEHDADAGLLSELIEALKLAVQSPGTVRSETLGFMLRGFFESRRRHISWEEQLVLPIARSLLTAADLADLEAWMTRADHPRCSRQNRVALRAARLQSLNPRTTARGLNASRGSVG